MHSCHEGYTEAPFTRHATCSQTGSDPDTTWSPEMANVTFSSPLMPRDLTVYAVAGERGTLLALAKRAS